MSKKTTKPATAKPVKEKTKKTKKTTVTAKKTVSKKQKQEVSKKEIKPQVNRPTEDLIQRFYQVVADLRTDEESKVFFLDFLTDSERQTFAKRLAIALELQSGKSYENIRQQYGVSSATISTVAEMMSSPGLQLALKKINTEQWAEEKSKKFMKLFGMK